MYVNADSSIAAETRKMRLPVLLLACIVGPTIIAQENLDAKR